MRGRRFRAGATLLVSRGFDAVTTLARIADPALGITHYFSVPQMAQMLWDAPGFAPNPKAKIERFVRAGIPMSDGFGMPVDDAAMVIAKAGSIGLPYIAVEARIVGDDGHDLSDGEVGELWVRGPSVTSRYWNQPETTIAAFTNDWFRTGDAARRDADGYYFLVDRRKDMFISGGENVYPAEVEAVIAELPDVAECAVIRIAEDRWGEVGCAFVVAVAGQLLAPDAIAAHCRARVAPFKVPKSVVVADTPPRTDSGKVQKHLLSAT